MQSLLEFSCLSSFFSSVCVHAFLYLNHSDHTLPQCHTNTVCLCLAIRLLDFCFSSVRPNRLRHVQHSFINFIRKLLMNSFVYCLCCQCLHMISLCAIAVLNAADRKFSTKLYTSYTNNITTIMNVSRTFSRIFIEYVRCTYSVHYVHIKNCLPAKSQGDNFKR